MAARKKAEPLLEEHQQITCEILIVGFGFSVVPLVRELELRGTKYTILSTPGTVWEALNQRPRGLSFDLVSSFHASFYTFDQISLDIIRDHFPLATDYLKYQRRLFKQWGKHVVDEVVESVTNIHVSDPDLSYSVVQTKSGRTFRAHFLVLAPGFTRSNDKWTGFPDALKTSLLDVSDQTVVLDFMGDTANMQIARAVAQGNRVIVLNDGFVALEKMTVVQFPGSKCQYTISLEAGEFATVGKLLPCWWKDLMSRAVGPPGGTSFLARWLWPDVLWVKYPQTYRTDVLENNKVVPAGMGNGMIVLKHWSIDTYQLLFGDDLPTHIRNGVLCNDIAFFIDQGLVEVWSKKGTVVDMNKKQLSWGDKKAHFDHFITSPKEAPRLPKIVSVDEEGNRTDFCYSYRQNYLGVVPSALRNVFFIGFTRPSTGGLANITEVQCLLAHKLLSCDALRKDLHSTIQTKLQTYTAEYYQPHRVTTHDHLVNYGLYVYDVAEFCGFGRPLSACFSWNPLRTLYNLQFELFFPNMVIKYRIEGEYALQGAREFAQRIHASKGQFLPLTLMCFSSLLDQVLYLQCIWLLFSRVVWSSALASLLWGCLCCGLAAMLPTCRPILNILTYSCGVVVLPLKLLLEPVALFYIRDWRLGVLVFFLMAFLVWASRQVYYPPYHSRYMMEDCKFKYRFIPFWRKYLEVYAQVERENTW
eukprot:gb/GEZN01003100.1/.p1 GENE.gb/GEZN01003100.1/~~gb/GEZN01003100.1/.p1  ORF type:complete len:699 (+),score=78.63 gb/GEZN01003100.1/:95-2191(+)